MSSEKDLVQVLLQVDAPPDMDPEQIARLTRQLRNEIRDLDVVSADMPKGGAAPEGAKGIEDAILNEIVVLFAAHLSITVGEMIIKWLMRQAGAINLTLQVRGKTLVLGRTAEGVAPKVRQEMMEALTSASQTEGGV